MSEEENQPLDGEECLLCGGLGYLEDECTCGDDTCCCLEPERPDCPECDS